MLRGGPLKAALRPRGIWASSFKNPDRAGLAARGGRAGGAAMADLLLRRVSSRAESFGFRSALDVSACVAVRRGIPLTVSQPRRKVSDALTRRKGA